MPRAAYLLLSLILIVICLTAVHAQDDAATATQSRELKTLVVAPKAHSKSVIVIPPAVSSTFPLNGKKNEVKADAVDLMNWIQSKSALNGLEPTGLRPWHIVVHFDEYDEDGDNVHSGEYEEYWTGPTKYKRIYKSDNFNQTDFATDTGLYREGDQQWPNATQSKVRAEIIDPFFYAVSLDGFHGRNEERSFEGYKLQCVVIEKSSGNSDPVQYCFEPGGSVLRYDRGSGWYQTVYNRIVQFQGRNLSQEVEVTNGGKAYLKLRVDKIESISAVNESDFIPPSDAIGPMGDRISNVEMTPTNTNFPEWPASMMGRHFTVEVEIIIGKDGHVLSAHGVSGPPDAYKVCEDALRKWIYRPFIVLDKPVEVVEKSGCTVN